jgi:aminoglycoside phosphotransferase (APT) family kinase protein
MTGVSQARSYSQRLGAITDDQFDSALRRAGLGTFVSAEPAPGGLFGQNVLLISTTGEHVFRGAPHWWKGQVNDAWQFPKEQLYARLLAEAAKVPVAWPQHLDAARDLFPWPYLIMPRLSGISLEDPRARAGLSDADHAQMARAIGMGLAGLQALTWDFAGDFDPDTGRIAPFEGGFGAYVATDIAAQVRAAGTRLTDQDRAWIEAQSATAAAGADGPAVYLHCDYSIGNVLFARRESGWAVSGVFDLMTSEFGDGLADTVRQACRYLAGRAPLARAFMEGWRDAGGVGAYDRLPAYVVRERLLIWEYFSRDEHRAEWTRGTSFKAWCEPFLSALRDIAQDRA